MVKSSMNEIEPKDAADGPVVSEGGRSPSTPSTGRAAPSAPGAPKPGLLAPGRPKARRSEACLRRARWRRASGGVRRASARWCCA